MRDHTNEDAARAEERWFRGIDDAPTPPSDAGTSEREKGRCARPGCDYARELHPVDDGDTYCPEFVPAAPAAEGPREGSFDPPNFVEKVDGLSIYRDPDGPNLHVRNARDGFCLTPRALARLAAALPGAEAGTPAHEPCLGCGKKLPRGRVFCDAACQNMATIEGVHQPAEDEEIARAVAGFMAIEWTRGTQQEAVKRRVAALTSEVRALRADKARLDWLEKNPKTFPLHHTAHGWYAYRAADLAPFGPLTLRDAIDAARLASPSPTGAP